MWSMLKSCVCSGGGGGGGGGDGGVCVCVVDGGSRLGWSVVWGAKVN
jgi:hypothetical protein